MYRQLILTLSAYKYFHISSNELYRAADERVSGTGARVKRAPAREGQERTVTGRTHLVVEQNTKSQVN